MLEVKKIQKFRFFSQFPEDWDVPVLKLTRIFVRCLTKAGLFQGQRKTREGFLPHRSDPDNKLDFESLTTVWLSAFPGMMKNQESFLHNITHLTQSVLLDSQGHGQSGQRTKLPPREASLRRHGEQWHETDVCVHFYSTKKTKNKKWNVPCAFLQQLKNAVV